MIGYLAYLVKQFIGLGYDGTVKICCINNYSALDYHQKKAAPNGRVGLNHLYRELLNRGEKKSGRLVKMVINMILVSSSRLPH